MTDTKQRCRSRILNYLKDKKAPVSDKELFKKTRGQKNPTKPDEFRKVINELISDGSIMFTDAGYSFSAMTALPQRSQDLTRPLDLLKERLKTARRYSFPANSCLALFPEILWYAG